MHSPGVSETDHAWRPAAKVAKLVYALDLGSSPACGLGVRVPPFAPVSPAPVAECATITERVITELAVAAGGSDLLPTRILAVVADSGVSAWGQGESLANSAEPVPVDAKTQWRLSTDEIRLSPLA